MFVYPQIDLTPIEGEGSVIGKMERYLADIAEKRWKEGEERRKTIGRPQGLWASSAGWAYVCPRRVAYTLLGQTEKLDWRAIAVFRTGDQEEANLYADLVASGSEIRCPQLGIALPHETLSGSPFYVTMRLDGIIRVCTDVQAVLEFKTGSDYEMDRWSPRREFIARKPTGTWLPPEPSITSLAQANMGIAGLRMGYIRMAYIRRASAQELSEPPSREEPEIDEVPFEALCHGKFPTAQQELLSDGTLEEPVDMGCLIGLDKSSQLRKGLLFPFDRPMFDRCMKGFSQAYHAYSTGVNTIARGLEPVQKTKTTEPELPKSPSGGCAYCPSRLICWAPAEPFQPTQDPHVIRLRNPEAPIPEHIS